MELKAEPVSKVAKLSTPNDSNSASSAIQTTCSYFLKRKKRLCRIMVARGEMYCGEHTPLSGKGDAMAAATNGNEQNGDAERRRVLCPIDPKHTVFERNLRKHLRICNSVVSIKPEYIVPDLNAGPTDCASEHRDFKLADIGEEVINKVVGKVNAIFDKFKIDETIEEQYCDHPLLANEMANKNRGHETLKHLTQTASILGQLERLQWLKKDTAFIEFGAGKGQVAYWLAKAIEHQSNSLVLLIDRASLRHKKDNKMRDTHDIHRIRADIRDFDMRKLDHLKRARHIVATGKHLCGAATDLAIRCMLAGNDNGRSDGKTECFIIALCCYHRCTWRSFVGKEFIESQGISVQEFTIIAKMVGWAVCGTGMSRERRRELMGVRGDGKNEFSFTIQSEYTRKF